MATKTTTGFSNNVRRKLALVIGIGDYKNGTNVPNAINDATKMSSALKNIGFIIYGNEPQLNLTYMDMSRTLSSFKYSIEEGDMVLFYFAGHGKQWEDQNYLIPANNFTDDGARKVALSGPDLTDHAINAQHLLDDIINQHPFVTIFFLDCCRTYHLRHTELIIRHDDQWAGQPRGDKSIPASAGSRVPNTRSTIGSSGFVLAFACAPGTIADDGKNGETNGLFTKHILKNISKPNEDIRMMLADVTDGVMEESNSRQIPCINSSLRHKNIYLYEPISVLMGTRPTSDPRLVTSKNNRPPTYKTTSPLPMHREEQQKQLFASLMQRMMMPIQSNDGRLMDEDGYFNEDGSRSFS